MYICIEIGKAIKICWMVELGPYFTLYFSVFEFLKYHFFKVSKSIKM